MQRFAWWLEMVNRRFFKAQVLIGGFTPEKYEFVNWDSLIVSNILYAKLKDNPKPPIRVSPQCPWENRWEICRFSMILTEPSGRRRGFARLLGLRQHVRGASCGFSAAGGEEAGRDATELFHDLGDIPGDVCWLINPSD